jgi:hypothetical protein
MRSRDIHVTVITKEYLTNNHRLVKYDYKRVFDQYSIWPNMTIY